MTWLNRLRNVVRSDTHSRDLDREFDFHIAERADDLVARGIAPDDAVREARRRFGNRGIQKERARDIDVFPSLDSIQRDVSYAWRTLGRTPAFTAVAVASLALGIGANAAIFGLIDALLLRPLPIRDAGSLVRVTTAGNFKTFTNPLWEELRDRQDVFSGVFATATLRADLHTSGAQRPVRGNWVSGQYFTTLGVRPAAGRLIGPADDVRGCRSIAVLGYSFWASEYGGDEHVIGKTISLSGHLFEIVGVAAPNFFGITVGETQAVYAPICAWETIAPGSLAARRNWQFYVFGRPKTGLSLAAVNAGLARISRPALLASMAPNMSAADQADHLTRTFGTVSGSLGLSYLRDMYGKALYILAAVSAIVLIVACANVANLLIARGAGRRREVAVRIALGASRARLTRQLLVESLMLSLAGAALGTLLAHWGGLVLVHMIGRNLPVYLDLGVDWRLLAFASAVAVVTAAIFGVVPGLRETAVDPQESMKSGGRGVVGRPGRLGLGRALVAAQLSLALVVVVAGGLLLATFRRLTTDDPGFTASRVLLISADLSTIDSSSVRRDIEGRFTSELSRMPGVIAVTTMNATPISGSYITDDVAADGPGARRHTVYFNDVGAGYFSTLGTPRIAGREFGNDDRVQSAPVAVLNHAAATLLFGVGVPIGRTFRRVSGPTASSPITVIGVVADAKYESLRSAAPPTIYMAIDQLKRTPTYPTYGVRASGDPEALTASITRVAERVDPRTRVSFKPLADQMGDSLTRERMLATLSTFFAGLTLLLATIGVYGVAAYGVQTRRNEIGVRMAVGATPRAVATMIMREAALLITIGLAVGLLTAMGLARLIASSLYGLAPSDPRVLAGSMVVVVVVAVLATLIPALRAANVDPTVAFRDT